MRSGRRLGLCSVAVLVLVLAANVRGRQEPYFYRRSFEPARPVVAPAPATEYSFARVVYEGNRGWGRRSMWATDYPKADRQFLMGVKRLSLIESGDGPVAVNWEDPRLFQYPILYAVEVGFMSLGEEHASRLREYLLRGGYLVVDDFHGPYEWARFEAEIRKVFPDRQIQEVDIADPVFRRLWY